MIPFLRQKREAIQDKLTTLDYFLLAAAGLFLLFFCWRLCRFNYHWRWQIVLPYLIKEGEAGYGILGTKYSTGLILEGFLVTLRISIYAMLAAAIIGFIAGFLRTAKRLFFRLTARFYVEMVRNTPALVLVFIFYYFISDQVLAAIGLEEMLRGAGETVNLWTARLFAAPGLIVPFLSGVLTLALFEGAYIAEIVRGGIESVPKGQWEAGAALGLSRSQQIRKIILPQAWRLMLPQLANEFINTIKWSSIVSIISIQELTYNGVQVIASTGAAIEVWSVVALIYLLLCLSLSRIVRRIECRTALAAR